MQLLSSFLGQRAGTILVAACVLVALAVAALVIMRLFGDAGRALGGRSRQQRLGVVDAFDLDRQRQLVIIRRDNVEHLVMIGGPNDLVIEAAFVRQPGAALAAAPPREREAPPPQAIPAAAPAFPPPRAFAEREPVDFNRREPVMAAPDASAPPAPTQRFPFANRLSRAAPPPREATVQPAIAPPAPADHAPPPPPPEPAPPPLAPASPAPEVVATAEAGAASAAPELAAPERPPSRLQQRLNAFPRPSRPFPTLRANPGGPLFPVRSAAKTPDSVAPPPEPPAPPAAPPAAPPPAAPTATPAILQGQSAGKGRADVLDAFESLEEEMAKLLGRPSGEG